MEETQTSCWVKEARHNGYTVYDSIGMRCPQTGKSRDRKPVGGFQGQRESDRLMGVGFSFWVMETLWNSIEMVVAQHERTKCHWAVRPKWFVGISPSLLKEGTELSTVHRDDLGSLAMLTEISRRRINEKIFSCLCSSHHWTFSISVYAP